jgi:hypothetical protein
VGRRGSVLGQHARADCAEGLTAGGRRAGDDRCSAAGWSQIEQRRAGRSGDEANRDTLQRTGRKQKPNPAGDEEQAAPGRTESQTRQHHHSTTGVIRHRAEQQQRGEQDDDVDREQQGERCRGEAELVLIDPVKG